MGAKLKLTIIYLLLTVWIFLGCNNPNKLYQNNDELTVSVIESEHGIEKTWTNKDSSLRIEARYFKNMDLVDSLTYVNGKLHGFQVYFTGNSIMKYNMINGVREGEEKCYYLDGGLEYEGQYENDKQYGEWKFYYKSGQLKTYEFHYRGELVYIRMYDENGKLTASKGSGFIYFTRPPGTDTISKGDTLPMNMYMAYPPNCIVNVNIRTDTTSDTYKSYVLDKCWLYNTEVFNDTGKQPIDIYWEIMDTTEMTMEQGDIRFHVYVK